MNLPGGFRPSAVTTAFAPFETNSAVEFKKTISAASSASRCCVTCASSRFSPMMGQGNCVRKHLRVWP